MTRGDFDTNPITEGRAWITSIYIVELMHSKLGYVCVLYNIIDKKKHFKFKKKNYVWFYVWYVSDIFMGR